MTLVLTPKFLGILHDSQIIRNHLKLFHTLLSQHLRTNNQQTRSSGNPTANEIQSQLENQPCFQQPRIGLPDDHFSFDPISSSKEDMKFKVIRSMLVYPCFVNSEDESSLMKEIEPYIGRLHYESSHWDDAIHEYRETERSKWNKKNSLIINRIRDIAFPPGVPQLKLVHILDLAAKGVIKPHIDSIRFCGNTIAGLSLLSDCVMRLRHDVEKDFYCDVFLPQLSLYVMSDFSRYECTHEILDETNSKFRDNIISRKRRISIVCRNEPHEEPSGPVLVRIPEN